MEGGRKAPTGVFQYLSGWYVSPDPHVQKSRTMEAAQRMGLQYYGLRIGCFGSLLSFTFASPVLPIALLSWMCLGVLFGLDFLWQG